MNLTRRLRRIFGGKPANTPPFAPVSASVPVTAPGVGDDVARLLPKLTAAAEDRLFNFFVPTFWLTSNPEAVTAAAKQIVNLCSSAHHFADNFLTWGRNMSMLDDRSFVKAWESNVESASDRAIVWRRYVLACAAYHCVHLDRHSVPGSAFTWVATTTAVTSLPAPASPN